MRINYEKQWALEFAARIKALGFTVYLAERGTYGFITDETESRVLSFQFNGLDHKLSGNYSPPSRESGTGWGMDKTPNDLHTADDVKKALYSNPPSFCGNGWKRLTTVAEHLKQYHSSSKYEKV